jgi:hypothetical protein
MIGIVGIRHPNCLVMRFPRKKTTTWRVLSVAVAVARGVTGNVQSASLSVSPVRIRRA